MNIEIKEFIEGARESHDVTVIIDILRFGSTAAALFGNGLEEMIAAASLDQARELRSSLGSGYLLAGEKKRFKPDGFDYGNSPSEVMEGYNGEPRKAIMVTTSGTTGINAATGASDIIIGSFSNFRATVEYLSKYSNICLVAMGVSGKDRAIEDMEYALAMRDALEGRFPNFIEIGNRIRADVKVQKVYVHGDPRDQLDLQVCLSPNLYDFVPIVTTREPYPIIKVAER